MALISPSAYRRRFDPNSGINMSNNPGTGSPTDPEAPLYPDQQPAPPQGGSAPSGTFNVQDFISGWTDPSKGHRTTQDLSNFIASNPLYAANLKTGGSKGDKVYDMAGNFLADAVLAAGAGGQGAQWLTGAGSNDPRPGSPQSRAMAAGGVDPLTGFKAGGVFDDPATKEWEQLLRTLNQRLQSPQPTYTPEQRDLMQTQAIDPLERLRQVQKQNATTRFASRGITPSSGILEQALQDIDRQFDQMRSQQQTGFALNQIGREDQLFNSNEQRALAGLNLFKQIPQMADSRLALANSMLIPSNPYQLLSLQNQVAQQGQQNQQYQDAQNQQFWLWLGQMMANAFQ